MATALERLKAVSRAVPVMDAEAAARATEAQRAQVSGSVAAAAPGAGIRQAQAVAPLATTAVAQPGLAAAAQTQQTLGQVAGQAAQVQAQAAQTAGQLTELGQRETLAGESRAASAATSAADRAQKTQFTGAELASQERMQRAGLEVDAQLSFLTIRQREDLSRLGRDVKQQLFDSRLAFDRDEAGRKFSNDRQMWDYTIATAESNEALQGRMQMLEQGYARKAQALDAAYATLGAELDRQFKVAEQAKDQASMRRIAETKRRLQEEADRKRHAGAQKGAIIGGVMSGAAAGAPLGVPGVIGGAVIGGLAGYQATKD